MKNKKMEKEREKCMFEMEQERIRSRRAEEAAQEIVRFRSRVRFSKFFDFSTNSFNT